MDCKMDISGQKKLKFLDKLLPCLRGIDIVDLENGVQDQSSDSNCPKKQEDAHSKSWTFRSMSIKFVRTIERLCGLWGLLVATYPVWASGLCLAFVLLLGLGIFNLNIVYRPYDLWVPYDSEFTQVTQWKLENFPPRFRKQIGIWESTNVLTAPVIKKMWSLHLTVESMVVNYQNESHSWKDVCLQFPSEYSDETWELAFQQGLDSYVCYEASLLEVWGYNDAIINNLTDERIIYDINSVNRSKLYGTETNFSSYLSGIERDEEGRIVKASRMLHTWLTRVDFEAIEKGDFVIDVARGDKVDQLGLLWEKRLVEAVESEVNGKNLTFNLRAGYTLGDVLKRSITQDVLWIIVGWILLIFYVILTIGKPFSKINRIIPAVVGLFSIALTVLATYGACSLMRIPYGTLTNVLPVLLVALGVDDMYVIVTAWDKICKSKVPPSSVETITQLTMEHAGMAITVTSLTDILAFVVGTVTSLPGLKWFCIYSVVGISVVYILQGTLFVAAMVINHKWQKRREYNLPVQDSVAPIKKFIDKKEIKWKIKHAFNLWCNFLMKPATKIIVVLVTLGILCFSLFNVLRMSKEFDAMWLVPKTSKLYYWYQTMDQIFADEGEKGAVYFKGVHIPDDLHTLVNLTKRLEEFPFIDHVDAWFKGLDPEEIDSHYEQIKDLSPQTQCELLLTYIDIKYRSHFQEIFDESENDGEHPCSLFLVEFNYGQLEDHDSKILAMEKVREAVRETNVSGSKAAWAHVYSYWETDKIILKELFQSLCIILSVVFLITLILLASLRASIFVLLCVVFTLIDVASFVHLWGLTVNTITSLAFVLAVGISVDYATHIAHDFLVIEGTRNQRAKSAILQMGFAVFHGGCSTLIAFLLLAPSGSYIFVTYFKILTGVSIFGLFHALIFLPVMLSILGPDSYHAQVQDKPTTDPPVSVSLELDIPAITVPKENFRYSADASAMGFYLPIEPPPYNLHHSSEPPLYRKSNSLPCLTFPLRTPNSKEKSKNSQTNNTNIEDMRHSSFCTKL